MLIIAIAFNSTHLHVGESRVPCTQIPRNGGGFRRETTTAEKKRPAHEQEERTPFFEPVPLWRDRHIDLGGGRKEERRA